MGNMKQPNKPKIILIPYPAQGHVTPMLKLSSSFLTHGFHPIIILPQFLHRQLHKKIEKLSKQEITFVQIPDGIDPEENPKPGFFAIEMAMEKHMPLHFERVVRKLGENNGDGDVVGGLCVVVDLMAAWAIEVAEKCGVKNVVGFWAAMVETYRLIASIQDMVCDGLVSHEGLPKKEGTLCSIPGQSVKINTRELPWLIGTLDERKSRFKFWKTVLNRTSNLRTLLVNSFPNDQTNNNQLIQFTEKNWKDCYPVVFHINTATNVTNPISFWDEELSCMNWLDEQKHGSVVYISFGSLVGSIGEKKVKDIALALESSGRPFLWVIGSAWRSELPDSFINRMIKDLQGKIVSWAPQMAVLNHKAVGCFLTHCGWNSTMEAIQCRKRMLCYPIAGDQFVNCAYIVGVWKIGVHLVGNFGWEVVEDGFKMVMEDGEMDSRLERLYQKAMGEEASLNVMGNLTRFMDNLAKFTSVF